VSVPTIGEWLSILEITGQILLVPPFYENFGKRLVKSPKLYFVDAGLACHLLGIADAKALQGSPFLGPIFEGAVASEIAKHRLNRGQPRSLHYFRDQQGLEVDFVIDAGDRRLTLVEAKATRTPLPEAATPLRRLADAIAGYTTASWLVHAGQGGQAADAALCPGVRAIGWRYLHEVLGE
jgi:predicted AAA+ superfamily ATPase